MCRKYEDFYGELSTYVLKLYFYKFSALKSFFIEFILFLDRQINTETETSPHKLCDGGKKR